MATPDEASRTHCKSIVVLIILVVCVLITICLGLVYWWSSGTTLVACDLRHSVVISGGIIYPNGSLVNGGMVYPTGYHFSVNGTTRGCPCQLKPCIRKCCSEEETLVTSTDGLSNLCQRNPGSKFNMSSLKMYVDGTVKETPEEYFNVVYGDVCFYGKFQLDPSLFPDDENYLTPEGKVIQLGLGEYEDLYYDLSMYCLDHLDDNEDIYTFTCAGHSDEQAAVIFKVQQIGMILSSPLLLATLVVYAVLSQLRNLPGLCLMCNVASLLTAYIVLPALQITGNVIPNFWCWALRKFSSI